jgi:hypothetical protein
LLLSHEFDLPALTARYSGFASSLKAASDYDKCNKQFAIVSNRIEGTRESED